MNVRGANISQMLFKQEENMLGGGKIPYSQLAPVNNESQEMKKITPAYVSQVRLSTYYQDNPWDTLLYSTKFGAEPLGGNVDLSHPPGYRPGNIFRKK